MAKSKTRTKREAKLKLEQEAIRNGTAKCGAKKAKGGNCDLKAGWGTTHEGVGKCRFHGGASPNGEMAAVKQKANAFATPIEVTPGQALAAVLHLAAGQLQWTTIQVGQLDEKDLIGEYGVHPMVRFQRNQMLDLAKLAKIAHEAGIDERLASLAEEQTHMFAKLIEAVAGEIDLSKEQRAKLGPAVRRHLTLIQGTATEEEAA
jgi:hypothetical protein